ncbi:hypothetical protein EJ03DRAFT_332188 [Teratosphaeria nubilosa]|uniref:Uncharacterized protein n=1 Tax=Teratosphaeria nubilosa TaxID=161662 RepID=A0A6G1KUU9_9PEZI|nr:hypothetical protein EJ03DRAFT_332188 [Teratosphaeria nubilosa]
MSRPPPTHPTATSGMPEPINASPGALIESASTSRHSFHNRKTPPSPPTLSINTLLLDPAPMRTRVVLRVTRRELRTASAKIPAPAFADFASASSGLELVENLTLLEPGVWTVVALGVTRRGRRTFSTKPSALAFAGPAAAAPDLEVTHGLHQVLGWEGGHGLD